MTIEVEIYLYSADGSEELDGVIVDDPELVYVEENYFCIRTKTNDIALNAYVEDGETLVGFCTEIGGPVLTEYTIDAINYDTLSFYAIIETKRVSKVVYDNRTLIDLTSDTVTAETLVTGVTAHGADGVPVVGVNPYEKVATDATVSEQTGLIEQIRAALAGKTAGGGGAGGGLVVGENLADPSGIISNKYIDGNGTEVTYNNWSISDYIPVDQAKRYSVAPFSILKNLQYSGFYDSNKAYLRQVSAGDFTGQKIAVLAPPADARYVRFSDSTANIAALGVHEVTEGSGGSGGSGGSQTKTVTIIKNGETIYQQEHEVGTFVSVETGLSVPGEMDYGASFTFGDKVYTLDGYHDNWDDFGGVIFLYDGYPYPGLYDETDRIEFIMPNQDVALNYETLEV